MKLLKNKYIQSFLRHALSIGGTYLAVKTAGTPELAGYIAVATSYLLSILDKYKA